MGAGQSHPISSFVERRAGGLGERYAGALRQARAEVNAERIPQEERRRFGWQESEVTQRRQNPPFVDWLNQMASHIPWFSFYR